jgi:hypothetical protein
MDEPEKKVEPSARGYEDDEVSVGRLFAFAAGVAGLVIFGVVASAVVFRFFVRHHPLGPPASPFENSRSLPPEPRLQITAPQDLKRYRADQDAILKSYGWVDRDAGAVRIPITRAVEILLQKGYPVRSAGPAEGAKAKAPRPAVPPAGHVATLAPAGVEGKN